MFAYLQQPPPEEGNGIKSFVAAAVPMAVFHPISDPLDFMLEAQPALNVGSRIVGSSAPATWGVIFGDLGTPMNKLFYNKENMDGGVLRDLFRLAEEEISPDQMKQLMNLVRTERFTSLDGAVDYTAALSKVVTPVYFLVGAVDNLAAVGSVQYSYRQVGSVAKQFRLFGRVNSYHRDYGHNDLIIGKQAREDVYPTILEWLNRFPCLSTEGEFPLQPTPLNESQK